MVTERTEDVEGVVRGSARPPDMNWKQFVIMALMCGAGLAVFVCVMIYLVMMIGLLGYGRFL